MKLVFLSILITYIFIFAAMEAHTEINDVYYSNKENITKDDKSLSEPTIVNYWNQGKEEYWSKPIKFYGQLIDTKGNPLPGLKLLVRWWQFSSENAQRLGLVQESSRVPPYYQVHTLITDSNGQFYIEGEGNELFIAEIRSKEYFQKGNKPIYCFAKKERFGFIKSSKKTPEKITLVTNAERVQVYKKAALTQKKRLNKELTTARKNVDWRKEAETLGSLANIEMMIGNKKTAREYYENACQLYEKNGFPDTALQIRNMINAIDR